MKSAKDIVSVDQQKHEHPTLAGRQSKYPWRYKAIALFCALAMSLGSHFANSALSATKDNITKNLDINNRQFSLIASAVAFVNTFLPICGGILIDYAGTGIGSITCTAIIAVGSLLIAGATNATSFPLMVIGRVCFGIGSGTIVTAQETIITQWFEGRAAALALSTQLSWARLASFLGNLIPHPLIAATGSYGWPLWLGAILCVLSVICNIVYVLLMRHCNRTFITEEQLNRIKKKQFQPKKVLYFNNSYWLVIFIEFFLAAIWNAFLIISTQFMKFRYGKSDAMAAYNSSIAQVVPIIVVPIVGLIFDRFGHRLLILVTSSVFLSICFGLLAYTHVNPIGPMVLFSISLALGPVAMISSIQLLVDVNMVGTALGIYKASNNIGSVILDITTGVIQDKTHMQSYDTVMLLLFILTFIPIVATVVLYLVDLTKYKGLLDVNLKKREPMIEEKIRSEQQALESSDHEPVVNKMNYLYTAILGIAMLVAWGMFFGFSVAGPKVSP
ncbi:MFS general substrate transporter [Basidiobolus meristosporus CBS 931.73]|uniref:Lysosomal dipeptide transporter MFSD1 n=1 Tax=Basidiobolus meristosporus CBS 931.73 TaxID=1314790 RepID=A0A1Y1YWA7_9FUNG|nr:MFS general substrate transporter [Basidiobolus meristosporus CBS 931.73]|eukprot:ORY02226.1 MFS general substrate transporter [Basidiobolus meristosporus CBS 931.73]